MNPAIPKRMDTLAEALALFESIVFEDEALHKIDIYANLGGFLPVAGQ